MHHMVHTLEYLVCFFDFTFCSAVLCLFVRCLEQGGLLASWVEPFVLSSIVVSANPRADGPAPLLSALKRAVPGRASAARRSSDQLKMEYSSQADVEVFVTSVVFDKSKAQVRGRRHTSAVSRLAFLYSYSVYLWPKI